MYNKLFTKILDSSIWLETSDTRIVFVTLLAAMDEDGFVAIATPTNLAKRANVEIGACVTALRILESPEPETAHADDDGRRIEKVPGGWMVLNARKYGGIVTRDKVKEATRLRVQRFREKKRAAACNAFGNAPVTPSDTNQTQTQSSGKDKESTKPPVQVEPTVAQLPLSGVVEPKPKVDPIEAIYQAYPRLIGKRKAIEAITRAVDRLVANEQKLPTSPTRLAAQRWLYSVTKRYSESPAGKRGTKTPHPATWFNQSRYLDDQAEWARAEEARTDGNSKHEQTQRNIAAAQSFIQRVEQGDGHHALTNGALHGLPAASGPERTDVCGVRGEPGDARGGGISPGVHAGATGPMAVLPNTGRAAQVGGRRNLGPTF